MGVPDVSYARSGDVAIAYQVVGDGPTDLVFVPFLANLHTIWLEPRFARFLRDLATGRRLVVINPRGVGLSDRPRGFTIESRIDDVRAVMDAVGIERAPLLGLAESGATCALFAASYPDRVERLVLYTPTARHFEPDRRAEQLARLQELREAWGRRDFLEDFARQLNPQWAADEEWVDWFVWHHRLTELGDRAWRDLLARHHETVRRELQRYRGEEIDTAGDGFFARFDGPARAIHCARAIVGRLGELGLVVRAGVHTGECERAAEKLAGLAVVVGARISAAATAGEVLVSSTVKDLVAGSGIEFEDRGEHELKGVGDWRLYSVVDA